MTPVRLPAWGKRASKYGNVRIKAAGGSFDSQSEAKRWQELQLLERAGEIRNLKLHPRYSLEVNGIKVCDYVADYSYECREGDPNRINWGQVVEDRKGVQTDLFKIKRKLMFACLGIAVLITGESN